MARRPSTVVAAKSVVHNEKARNHGIYLENTGHNVPQGSPVMAVSN